MVFCSSPVLSKLSACHGKYCQPFDGSCPAAAASYLAPSGIKPHARNTWTNPMSWYMHSTAERRLLYCIFARLDLAWDYSIRLVH
jgi:hypothetical protein